MIRTKEVVRSGFIPLVLSSGVAGFWMILFGREIHQGASQLWFPTPSITDLLEVFPRLLTYDIPLLHTWKLPFIGCTNLALLLFTCLLGFIVNSLKTIPGGEEPSSKFVLLTIFAWLAIPILSAWILAQFGHKGFYFRTLAFCSPALCIVLGILISKIRLRQLVYPCIYLVLSLSVGLYTHYYNVNHKEGWRNTALAIDRYVETMPIVLANPGSLVPLNYYLDRKFQVIDLGTALEKSTSFIYIDAHSSKPLLDVAKLTDSLGYKLEFRRDFPGIKVRIYKNR